MNIRCPECKTRYHIKDSKISEKKLYARCARCQVRFAIGGDRHEHDASPSDEPQTQCCSQCGQKLGWRDRRFAVSGRPVCEKCYQTLNTRKREKPVAKPCMPRKSQVSDRSGGIFGMIGRMFSNDMAIDLGTANTLVYIKKKGVVLNEASVVALRTDARYEKSVVAVGCEAKEMMGKTPQNITAVRPMRDGVIADFETTGIMLKHFIRKARKGRNIFKPRMMIAIPSGITQVEKWAVKEAAEEAGARSVFLIEEPMAAAIGADLPVTAPVCNMVVDIGGGTTEVATISLAGVVSGQSIKIAGDRMDEAIMRYIRKKFNFAIGERTAEFIKMTIGNASPDPRNPEVTEVKGWNVISGEPKIFSVNALEIREAIAEQLDAIVEAVKVVLDRTPQELTASVIDRGILLTGGGALLKKLDKFLMEKSGLPVTVADDPLSAIVLGSGKAMGSPDIFRRVAIS